MSDQYTGHFAEQISNIVPAVLQMRERIAEFYRGHPEREEAAKRWWAEHTKERDEK